MFPVIIKSITVDNGSEFSDCEGMERSVLDPTKKRTKFYIATERFAAEFPALFSTAAAPH